MRELNFRRVDSRRSKPGEVFHTQPSGSREIEGKQSDSQSLQVEGLLFFQSYHSRRF